MEFISEIPQIKVDENAIRKILDEVIAEKSAQTCAIPISIERSKHGRRSQGEIIEVGI